MTDRPILLPYPEPLGSQDDGALYPRLIAPADGITRQGVADHARAYEREGTYFGLGQCLKFSRTCAEAPGGVYDAREAWDNAEYKHRGDGDAPLGTFYFWAGGSGGHGHVAPSVGGGWAISTDVLRVGRADLILADWIDEHWGLTRRGWTEDINGVRPAFGEWDEMATKAEIREVMDNALAAALTADNAAFVNAVRVAAQQEFGDKGAEIVDGVWRHPLVDPVDGKTKTTGTILRYSQSRAKSIVERLKGTW